MTCKQPKQSDTSPTVLVIDDELGPRESLRFLLKDDYRVVCADEVGRGLQLLDEHAPDLVIMDIRMPGRSGIEGLREIRKRDTDLAVIMLTGFAAVGTAQDAIRHEASDYMEKPFDAAEMQRAVRHHIEQTRLRRKRSRLLNEADTLDQHIRELQSKDLMVELGQSSAEFIHDLRNALTVVTGSSCLLRLEVEGLQQRQTGDPSEARHYLDMQERAMQQCVEMLDTWQRLIKQNPQQQTRLLTHAFVRDCMESSQLAVQAANAQLTCEMLGEDIELLGDRTQLTRVLTNLILNALHALPAQGGRIRVCSEIRDTEVRISVSDNGCGISEQDLPRIFTPDFSTRRKLGGMGLGLFIAQKVAQAHKGFMRVESVLGEGSTFTLQLPRTALAPVTDADCVA